MRPLRLVVALLLGLSGLVAVARDNQSALDLIFQGVELHDRGDYDGAVAKYRAALEIAPDNTAAQYELALTLTAQGKLDEALVAAERGSAVKSRQQAEFLDLYGNLLDNKGKSAQAMSAYQQGLKLAPDFAALHYDLGITAAKLGKMDLALEHLKKNIEERPAHPAGQFALARIWEAEGYPIPALFAYMRFLSVSENTPQSKEAAQRVLAQLNRGVDKSDGKHINIMIDPKPRKGEGDFGPFQVALAFAAASQSTEKKAELSESERVVDAFDTALALFEEMADAKLKKTFAYRNYADFLASLRKEKHLEAFTYVVLAQMESPDAVQWMSAHTAKVDAYRQWARLRGVETPAVKM